jgi:bifunctional N-acetylglucosamine-1-phosphate-uridyltransferase/glucosamine-1-phosphate-acetyltransferase GlmU-like protein
MKALDCDSIIFLVDYTAYSNDINSYNINIFGKSMLEYVSAALQNIKFSVIAYDEKTNILNAVKYLKSQKRFTVVLFSDTPLLRYSTIYLAAEIADKEDIGVLRLPRGYIIKNSALDNIRSLDDGKIFNLNEEDFFIVSDYKRLENAGSKLRNRIIDYHLDNGVQIIDRGSVYIDSEVVIQPDVTIYPNNTIKGKSTVYGGATIYENNLIDGSVIYGGATVLSSTVEQSAVGAGSSVGPNAHLRPGTTIGSRCKIGNFVEIKNSQIGDDTKISHLTYVGDAEVGCRCNIGCGVVFVNYDGKSKYKAIVEDDAFIGSNCNLISPLRIGRGCLIAAGSTITRDVPSDCLAVGRARQENKEGRAKQYFDRRRRKQDEKNE